MTAAPRRRTQRERRERTEEALIAAAADIVVESGVHALTLASVGERAGYSRGIVTHHFGAKQGLIDALAQATQRGFVPRLGGLRPGLERLLALVDGYLAELAHLNTAGRAFLLLWAEAVTAPALAPTFRARDQAFRADLRADVVAGIAEGSIRADVSPDDAAAAVVGQLRGLGLQQLLDPDNVRADRMRAEVTQQWRNALAAGQSETWSPTDRP